MIKKFNPQLAIDSEFLPILVWRKTKGTVGAVCAFLRKWQLGASLPITLLDGAVNLKGSHMVGAGGFF